MTPDLFISLLSLIDFSSSEVAQKTMINRYGQLGEVLALPGVLIAAATELMC
jgi:hypothetical protein